MLDRQDDRLQVAKRKIAILGFTAVGKTALCTSFVQGVYLDTYNPTITNTFHTTLPFRRKNLNIEILDTAGLDGHTQISRHAAVGIHGYIMLYSCISKNSFENIKIINENLLQMLGNLPDVPRVLVGSMSDLHEARQVAPEQGKALAEQWRVPFLECSAKEDINIDSVFKCLMKEIERAQGTLSEEPVGDSKCAIA